MGGLAQLEGVNFPPDMAGWQALTAPIPSLMVGVPYGL